MKFIGIANRLWQVVSQGLFSSTYIKLRHALLNLFSICSVSLCSLEVRGSQRGETWAANLPSLTPTLLHFKVSVRTLRSPTLHLRWRIKETLYALKKLIPEDGCQPVMILPWIREAVFIPFAKSDAIRSAFYKSIIFIPSVDTVLMCFWMSCYAEGKSSLQ